MDREQMIGRANVYYHRNVDRENGIGTVQMWMADFALEVLAERDAEMRQAELESFRRVTCPECSCGIS